MKYFSPFETNIRLESGWRWYWCFLRDYPTMVREAEHDAFACLIERGLVCA